MHHALRGAAAAAFALFLIGVAPTADANATPSTCSGVVQITHLAFDSPTVMRGQTATAHVTARNCTTHTVTTSLMWTGSFLGPTVGTIPPGCPVIDPVAEPVTFAPLGSNSASIGYLIFPSCTATALRTTATFSQAGTVLAKASATVTITG